MNTPDKTVGQWVAESYRTAPVFKKYGIDYCCKGGKTLAEACSAKGLNVNDLEVELTASLQENSPEPNQPASLPLQELVKHIETIHHTYVERRIGDILPLLDKVYRVHGASHPELAQIQQLFQESAADLTVHMKKEELVLFPLINQLAAGKGHPAQLQAPISAMMMDHEDEGSRFENIEKLTHHFTPPQDACTSFRVLYSLLEEFKEDLHQHIHLENNILFPRALALN